MLRVHRQRHGRVLRAARQATAVEPDDGRKALLVLRNRQIQLAAFDVGGAVFIEGFLPIGDVFREIEILSVCVFDGRDPSDHL